MVYIIYIMLACGDAVTTFFNRSINAMTSITGGVFYLVVLRKFGNFYINLNNH